MFAAQVVARNHGEQSCQEFVASARGIATDLANWPSSTSRTSSCPWKHTSYLQRRASQSTFQAWITSSHRVPALSRGHRHRRAGAGACVQIRQRGAGRPPARPRRQWHVPGVAAGGPALLLPGRRGEHRGPSRPPRPGSSCWDGGLGAAFLKARDSGVAASLPFWSGTTSVLVLGTPLYAGGVGPDVGDHTPGRLHRVERDVDRPGVVLAPALGRAPCHSEVAFHYRSNGYSAHVPVGLQVPAHSQSTTINLQNGWTVRGDRCRRRGGSVLANGDALAVLVLRHRILPADGRSLCPCWRPAGPRALEMVRDEDR